MIFPCGLVGEEVAHRLVERRQRPELEGDADECRDDALRDREDVGRLVGSRAAEVALEHHLTVLRHDERLSVRQRRVGGDERGDGL